MRTYSKYIEHGGLLIPTDGTCVDGTVHLVGGDSISRGRVLYCHGGSWYSLCADDWGEAGEEARLICQSLGYNTSHNSRY